MASPFYSKYSTNPICQVMASLNLVIFNKYMFVHVQELSCTL